MAYIHKNQPVEIRLGTGHDVTTSSSWLIKFTKPSGTSGSWTAAAMSGTAATAITYTAPADTIDERGKWRLWSYVTFSDARAYPGDTVEQMIYDEGELVP
ncbi:MAG: hypothetical protein ACYS8Y_14415 [Planctomycetota bacterium]|jgi:hypothetical protein